MRTFDVIFCVGVFSVPSIEEMSLWMGDMLVYTTSTSANLGLLIHSARPWVLFVFCSHHTGFAASNRCFLCMVAHCTCVLHVGHSRYAEAVFGPCNNFTYVFSFCVVVIPVLEITEMCLRMIDVAVDTTAIARKTGRLPNGANLQFLFVFSHDNVKSQRPMYVSRCRLPFVPVSFFFYS